MASGPVTAAGSGLIRFDRRSRIFFGLLLLCFTLATSAKLHGSSIGLWNRSSPDRAPDAGVLLGTPKRIRSDEWALTTLAIVSQAVAQPSLPVTNEAWGPERVPLIFNLPVRHWSMAIRPQFWGFFVLDLERAFAFYWNMKALMLIGGVFLLLMLLTSSHFAVAVFGTGWVFFSGFIQWWYSTPAMLPEMIGCVALILVAMHYLLLSDQRRVVLLAAAALAACLVNGVLSLYPPFQIPLFYVGVAILAGSLGPRLRAIRAAPLLGFRVGGFAAALVVVALLLGLFYRDAEAAIGLMTSTVYPGSRVSAGGDVSLAQVFSGFYGFFMSESSHPEQWGNVCEASNFVLLFPIPLGHMLWRAFGGQSVRALEWSLAATIIVLLLWSTIGGSPALGLLTALGLSPATRPLLGVGLASILLCCVYLASPSTGAPARVRAQILAAASIAAGLALFGWYFERATDGFASLGQLVSVSVVGAVAGAALLGRRRLLFSATLLVPSIWFHGLVNPVAVGLAPILEARVVVEASRIVARDPDARWVAYGNHTLPDLIKTAGANVFNGTKVVPPLDDLRVLDPDGRHASIYNRFAHIRLSPQYAGVSFTLAQPDLYTIGIDPMNDAWRRLGIRYVVFPVEIFDAGFLARTTLVSELRDVGLWIYRYDWNDAPEPPRS